MYHIEMSWTDMIFGSPTRVAFLRTLAAYAGHPLSIRELARLAGMSPIQASRLARDLARVGIVLRSGERRRPVLSANLGHPVMRELVLPLLAFEDHELTRVATAIAESMSDLRMVCLAVLSTVASGGEHRLIMVVPNGTDTGAVAPRLYALAPPSVLNPTVEVVELAGVRRLSPGALRGRWGASVSRLFEEDRDMSSLPSSIRHDFGDGVEGWLLHDPVAQRVSWLGREALMLGGARPALAPVARKPPYTIKAMLGGGPGDSYVGFCFHLVDVENYETIYLAPGAGGQPTAIQYDPVINGSTTWQIFGDADGMAEAPLRKEHWHLLRIDVWTDIAQVYVDDESSPRATFPLRSGRREGRVGLWAYNPSYVADYEVRPLEAVPPPPPEPRVTVPAGTVREWLVARYDEQAGAFIELRPATTEHNGILCLNRLYRAEPGARAFAACEIEVPPGAQQAVLEVGYSDRARVWLNGALLHEGEWRWDPPAGADGRIRPGHRKIPIPAEPGRHLLVVEITYMEIGALEAGFGWGLTARVVADGKPCQWSPASTLQVPSDL